MRNMLRIAEVAVSMLFLLSISGAQECSKGCVYTHGYDESRDNVNPNKSILKATSLSLSATNSPDLSGIVYAQPLYVSQVSVKVNGQPKTVNALFVATEENYVYALDADTISNPPFWSTNLNVGSETAVPDTQLPRMCGNIAPEVGITGTPVIDTGTNLLYVVSKSYLSGTTTQRLNVLNLYDGSAAATAVNIGNVLGSSFSALNQNQRAGLALVSQGDVPQGGPFVYIAWGAHCDGGAYNGWVASFHYSPGNPNTLTLKSSFNDEQGTGASQGGIWMSGAAPAVTGPPASQNDADVYLATGNGSFLAGSQYGESVLRLDDSTGSISVTGSYTPNAWSILNKGSYDTHHNCVSPLNLPPPYTSGSTVCVQNDMDLGAGGVMLVRPTGSGYLPTGDSFVVLAGGKQGVLYVLDPSNMSNTGADTTDPCSTGTGGQTIQCFGAIQIPTGNLTNDAYGNRGSAAFWGGNSTFQENVLYVAGSQDSKIRAYQMTASGGGAFTTSTLFGYAPTPNPNSSGVAPYPGSSPVISWNNLDSVNGDKNAILWILDTSATGTGTAKLFAYQAIAIPAGNQFTQEWHDTTNGPWATRFMVPTVVNGYVYVGGEKPDPNGQCKAAASGGNCLGRVVAWH